MAKNKYVKPLAQSLDRTLAVSMGGCAYGKTPGTCGLPGFNAGSCNPTGTDVGVPYPGGGTCNPTGSAASWDCVNGARAAGGCLSTGFKANAPAGGGG